MANPQSTGTDIAINTLKAPEFQSTLRSQLPKDVPLDRFTEAAAAALRNNPDAFHDCDRNSLYNAIADAARKGVIPDGKQGALTVFNTNVAPAGQAKRWVKKAQFMIMPEGIIAAFNKAGIDAYAQSVYANDDFKFWADDDGQHVTHNFNPFQDRGERIGSFASGKRKNGRPYVEAMSMDELKRAMTKSKGYDRDTGKVRGPWFEWPERMEQKSALHRLDKRMPGAGIVGDEDVEPDVMVATVPQGADTGTTDSNMEAVPGVGKTQALTDGSKRPRGLQGIIDADIEPEPEMVHATRQMSQPTDDEVF